MKKFGYHRILVLLLMALLAMTCLPALAEEAAEPGTVSAHLTAPEGKEDRIPYLTDGVSGTRLTLKKGESLTITPEAGAESVLVTFYTVPCTVLAETLVTDGTVTATETMDVRDHLVSFSLQDGTSLRLTAQDGEAAIGEVTCCTVNYEQDWTLDATETDLLVILPEPGDETLLLGGLLAQYAGENEITCTVAYVAARDGYLELEALDALGALGVTQQPRFLSLDDKQAESESHIQRNMGGEKAITNAIMELILSVRPQVVVLPAGGDDALGSVVEACATKAISWVADASHTDGAEPHQVTRAFLAGQEGATRLSWTEPLNHFFGATAQEVATASYQCYPLEQVYGRTIPEETSFTLLNGTDTAFDGLFAGLESGLSTYVVPTPTPEPTPEPTPSPEPTAEPEQETAETASTATPAPVQKTAEPVATENPVEAEREAGTKSLFIAVIAFGVALAGILIAILLRRHMRGVLTAVLLVLFGLLLAGSLVVGILIGVELARQPATVAESAAVDEAEETEAGDASTDGTSGDATAEETTPQSPEATAPVAQESLLEDEVEDDASTDGVSDDESTQAPSVSSADTSLSDPTAHSAVGLHTSQPEGGLEDETTQETTPQSPDATAPVAQESLLEDETTETDTTDYFLAEGEPEEIMADYDAGQWSYRSQNLSIRIERVTLPIDEEKGTKVVAYIADIRMQGYSSFRSGVHDTQSQPWKYARNEKAILAITGDNLTTAEKEMKGCLVRNGKLYSNYAKQDTLAISADGMSLACLTPEEFTSESLLDSGVRDSYSFGPTLVRNGEVLTEDCEAHRVAHSNPRCGVGMVEPGHWIAICTDGRQSGYSWSIDLTYFAQMFKDLGCTTAYNLDGGSSTAMVFMGEVLTLHYGQGSSDIQRNWTDSLMWGYSEAVPTVNDPVSHKGVRQK